MAITIPPLTAGVLLCPEKLYAVTALIVVSGAFRPLLVGYANATEMAFADAVRIQLVLSGVYIVAAMLLLRPKVFQSALLSIPTPLILILGYTAVSFAWSSVPGLTLKRLVPLLGSTLVGVYLGARFTLEGFLRVAFVACFAITAGSLFVGFALPQYGIQPAEAAWAGLRGVFANKNSLGSIAAFAALVSVYHIKDGWHNRSQVWVGAAGLALAMFCLIQSLSVSSYINAVVTIVAVVVLRFLQRSGNPVVPAIGCMALILVGGIVLSLANLSAPFEMIGRDATLTGRVSLWTLTTQLIAAHPWLGYGYATARAGAPLLEAYFHVFQVQHVHNGFLQVTLELGFLGLALCLVFLGQVASRCALLLMGFPSFRSTFPAVLLLLVLFNNMVEVNLLYGQSLEWCLLVFVAVQAKIDLGRRRSPAAFGRPGLKPATYRNDTFETGPQTSGASGMTLQ